MSVKKFKVGVLAVQGAFAEHISALQRLSDDRNDLDLEVVEVRVSQDLTYDLLGLIIPGGESTTLNVFFQTSTLFHDLKVWQAARPRVIWGTCAGLIFLSDNLEQEKLGGQLKLGGLNVTTRRNFFGRQRQSFEQEITVTEECKDSNFPGIFIRAPGIVSVDSKSVRVLANLRNGGKFEPVAVEQDNLMASSFHPELSEDLWFHQHFVSKILNL